MGAIGMMSRGYAGALMENGEDLIVRARHGDEDAFRQIFQRYTRPVMRFIFYMINNRALAEELAQETFIRAYTSINTLRDDTKISTWLFGIARNVTREALRANRHDVHRVDLEHADSVRDDARSPAGQLLDKELTSVVTKALGRLDEDKRLVFTLKVYQQHSYDEIAEITGFSLPKIRNDLYRARAEMRQRLGGYLQTGGANHEM